MTGTTTFSRGPWGFEAPVRSGIEVEESVEGVGNDELEELLEESTDIGDA